MVIPLQQDVSTNVRLNDQFPGLDSPFEAGVLLLVKEPQDDGGYKRQS